MILYFAYGSNMDRSQMNERCPDNKFNSVCMLKNHRLGFTRYSRTRKGGVADIVFSPGAEVWGALFEISPNDLESLDRSEGYPTFYNRREVEIVEISGTPIFPVWTYQIVAPDTYVAPDKKYIDQIIEAGRVLGLKEEYLSSVERIAKGLN